MTFEWNTDRHVKGVHMGFIAQNVQQHFPVAISVGEDDMKTLSIGDRPILAASVGAIQELNAKLAAAEKLLPS